MTIRHYLDECRRHTNTGSDYAVAKLLGVSADAINHYRKGDRAPGAGTCRKIAEQLGVPMIEVLAAAELERTRHPKERAAWRKWMKRPATKVAAVIALVLVDTIGFVAYAESGRADAYTPPGHSVMWHAYHTTPHP